MIIEAPLSRYRKNNIRIYIALCIIFAGWFAYDGYFNEKFISKHTDAAGKPDSTLVFNRNSPPYVLALAVLLGAYLFVIRNKKLLADETSLTAGKLKIPYDSIGKIDKTRFNSKGYFVITYKDPQGDEAQLKFSSATYDNLPAVMEALIAKIT
jgi:hypothetical protein